MTTCQKQILIILMRFLFTFILTLVIGTCLSQPDTLDTVVRGDVVYIYSRRESLDKDYYDNTLLEKIHYKGDQIDIKVIYIYRAGVLVSRQWWRGDKMLSYTLED